MRQVTLNCQTTQPDQGLSGYMLLVSVASVVGVPREIFVMRRYTKYDGTISDAFVGVCGTTQLEDLEANAPSVDCSFYRTSEFAIVSSSSSFLDWAYRELLADVRFLCEDLDALDSLGALARITVTSDDIVGISMLTLISNNGHCYPVWLSTVNGVTSWVVGQYPTTSTAGYLVMKSTDGLNYAVALTTSLAGVTSTLISTAPNSQSVTGLESMVLESSDGKHYRVSLITITSGTEILIGQDPIDSQVNSPITPVYSLTGSVSISSGVNSGVVTGLALPFVPIMIFLTVEKPVDAFNIFATVTQGSITANGFSYDLSGDTDSTDYKLNYLLVK